MSLWRRVYAERRVIVLPLLVLLGANVAVLALGVLPIKRAVASDTDAAVLATAKLVEARQLETAAKNARASKDQADVELKKFYAEILPPAQGEARRVAKSRIEQMAAQANLTFKNSQYDFTPVKESRLTRVDGKVTLRGDYASIRRFLYAVETAPEFVVIEKVEVSQPAQQTGGGAVAMLDITLDVATYYLSDESGGAHTP